MCKRRSAAFDAFSSHPAYPPNSPTQPPTLWTEEAPRLLYGPSKRLSDGTGSPKPPYSTASGDETSWPRMPLHSLPAWRLHKRRKKHSSSWLAWNSLMAASTRTHAQCSRGTPPCHPRPPYEVVITLSCLGRLRRLRAHREALRPHGRVRTRRRHSALPTKHGLLLLHLQRLMHRAETTFPCRHRHWAYPITTPSTRRNPSWISMLT